MVTIVSLLSTSSRTAIQWRPTLRRWSQVQLKHMSSVWRKSNNLYFAIATAVTIHMESTQFLLFITEKQKGRRPLEKRKRELRNHNKNGCLKKSKLSVSCRRNIHAAIYLFPMLACFTVELYLRTQNLPCPISYLLLLVVMVC